MEHDALIHLAFEYGTGAAAADKTAIETLIAAGRQGKGKRIFVYTSGVWVLGETGDRAADERSSTEKAAPAVAWRPTHERLALEGEDERLTAAVVRPGIVYGGKAGIISQFFASAVRDGAAVYVGTGANRWPPIHRDDLAQLYRLVIEAKARGIFHGVDGMAVPVKEIARAASEAAGKGGLTRATSLEEARKTWGPMADALCMDQVVVAHRSAELGWKPTKPSFPEGAKAAYKEWVS